MLYAVIFIKWSFIVPYMLMLNVYTPEIQLCYLLDKVTCLGAFFFPALLECPSSLLVIKLLFWNNQLSVLKGLAAEALT